MRKILMLIMGVTLIVLVGCEDIDWEEIEDGEKVTESVEEYRFDVHDTRDKVIYLYTDKRAYVWGVRNITFVETGKDFTEVEYIRDDEGNIQDRKIYLAEGAIKGYSTDYADLFGSTLKTLKEENGVIAVEDESEDKVVSGE